MNEGYNADITQEQIDKLQADFPEIFSENKIDFDRLRATLGGEVDLGERYGLSWKGKSGVFAKIQEKTVDTLHPQPSESVDWDTTQNMFIEGDNLDALKILHKSYYGKIKMIYIDPPYNTGNDFVYNDDFKQNRREYDAEAGIVDDEGFATRDDGLRANTGGHKHSNWLNMMYPRLFLARNLLRQDGVIFVSIDDNEVHNLRMIMNEIFGEENFVAQFIWNNSTGGGLRKKHVNSSHEYIICYSRSVEELPMLFAPMSEAGISAYSKTDENGLYREQQFAWQNPSQNPNQRYPILMPDGTNIIPKSGYIYRFIEPSFLNLKDQGRITFKKTKSSVYQTQDGGSTNWSISVRDYLGDATTAPVTILPKEYVRMNIQSVNEIQSLFGAKIFDYSKPTTLIQYLIKVAGVRADDIVLDFFAGSGTTAHAVEQLNAEDGGNRKWICVQLPEQTDEKSEAYKAGYKTIAEISRERIRRAGAKIATDFADKIAERETPLDLGFRSYCVGGSNFKKWNELLVDPDEIRQQAIENIDPIVDGTDDNNLLTEILLKRGISPLAKIEMLGGFYFVPSESLVISLAAEMTEDLFAEILAKSPSQTVMLDRAFGDDANLKANLVLLAERADVIVEVV